MSDLPKRERKQVDAYRVEVIAPTNKSVSIQTGTGIKLSEYPFFLKGLDKLKGDDELVKSLHSLMFSVVSKKLEAKKNIRLFSGFADEKKKDEKKAKVLENKKKWTVQLLKDAMALFGLEKSGSRNELIDRLLDYLMSPTAIKEEGAKVSGAKKSSGAAKTKGTKRKATNDTKAAKAAKIPRAPSSYILFSTATRQEIKDANPDSTFGEIGVLLGQKWKSLDEDEKQIWTDLAATKAAAMKEAQAAAGEGEEEEDEEDDDDNDDDLFGDGDALYGGGDEKEEKEEEEKEEGEKGEKEEVEEEKEAEVAEKGEEAVEEEA